MGGMGFIENNKALCMLSSVININLLKSAKKHNIKKFLFFFSLYLSLLQTKKLSTSKIKGKRRISSRS